MREPSSKKQSKTNPEQFSIERREFLKAAGVATAGMAQGVVVSNPAMAQEPPEAKKPYGGGTKLRDNLSKKDFGAVGDGVLGGPVNFVTDYGGDPTGASDSSAELLAFTNDHQGKSVELFIPPGNYCYWHQEPPNSFFKGIRRLKVKGYGAVFAHAPWGSDQTGQGFICGASNGIAETGTATTARIASVSKGSLTLTLLDLGDASKFTANHWIMISGLDLMGYGAPPDPHWFEFQQIESIVGTSITIKMPLQNTYLSTWPLYWEGDAWHCDQGGPATIYALDAEWDAEIEIEGLKFLGTSFIQARVRRIKWYNCEFAGQPLPSVQKEYIVERCRATQTLIEVDKSVESVVYRDSYLRGVQIQSSSIDRLVIENCSLAKFGLWGTARNTVVRDSYLKSLTIGPAYYGISETLLVESCRVDAVAISDRHIDMYDFTIANGIITIPNAGNGGTIPPIHMAVPGAAWIYAGNAWGDGTHGCPFIITDVRQDGTNTYIDTTLPTTLPDWSSGTNPWYFLLHPCLRTTVVNCVGCAMIVDMSNAPKDSPGPYGYARRLYTGNIVGSSYREGIMSYREGIMAPGYLVKIRINVIRPYTGTQQKWLSNEMLLDYFDAFYTKRQWNAAINLKVAGERIITPGNVVALSGDSIPTLAERTWFRGDAAHVAWSGNIEQDTRDKWPIVEFEVITDMGPIVMAADSFKITGSRIVG